MSGKPGRPGKYTSTADPKRILDFEAEAKPSAGTEYRIYSNTASHPVKASYDIKCNHPLADSTSWAR